MLNTELTRSWGLQHPLFLAPMAGVAGGELAAAVSRAGGLGLYGIGAAAASDWIAAEAAKARRGGGPWGAGLMAWALVRRPDLLEALLAEKPDVVSISFGDPSPYVEAVHAAGAKVVSQVQDAASAIQAIDAGVDAVIAQGTEAGGHTGGIGTLPMIQIVLELAAPKSIPVLAAGGIATGRGIAGALARGCAGVWVGTPFIATEEATNSEAARSKVLRSKETDTVLTRIFDIVQEAPWPEQFPGRALVNDFTAKWAPQEDELRASLPEAQAEFTAARQRDDYTTHYIYAGQSVGLVREVVPAGRLVSRLMGEAEDVLRGTSGLVS
jgi:nitronate monooxygenase